MPVETGTYTDRSGFFQTLHDFADNALYPNFSVHDWDSTNQTYLTIKYIDPDFGHTLYYNFYDYTTNYFTFSVTSGWSASRRTSYHLAHPGNAYSGVEDSNTYAYSNCWEISRTQGTVTGYTLITDGHYCAIITELTPGVYTHFVFGRSTDGPGNATYCAITQRWDTGSSYIGEAYSGRHGCLGGEGYSHQYITLFFDAGDGVLRRSTSYPSASNGGSHRLYSLWGMSQIFSTSSSSNKSRYPFLWSQFPGEPANRTYLVPVPIMLTYTAPTNHYNRAGYYPGFALSNCKYVNPGDTVNYGGEDYLVFPLRKKNVSRDTGNGGADSSHFLAYAYKVV